MGLELIKNHFTPKSVLDIGANVGQFYHKCKEIFPDSEYFLIEGNKHCEPGLSPLNVPYEMCLLSKEEETVDFYIRKTELRCTGNSIYREKTHFFADDDIIVEKTETKTLNKLFGDRTFDLVKIDTQGSEIDIINGGIEFIKRAKGVLMEVSLEEFNTGSPLEPYVNNFMYAIGFEPKEIIENLTHPETHHLIQKDVLFINKNLV